MKEIRNGTYSIYTNFVKKYEFNGNEFLRINENKYNDLVESDSIFEDDTYYNEHHGWLRYRVTSDYINGIKNGREIIEEKMGDKWEKIIELYYKNGKIDGTYYIFSFFGNDNLVTSKIQFINGIPNGEYELFGSSLRREDGDNPHSYYSYEIIESGSLVNGKKDGTILNYDCVNPENFIYKDYLYSKTNFKDGKKDGWEIIYFSNGNKKNVVSYINGIKDGRETSYSIKGKVTNKIYFKNGKANGEYNVYRSEGNMRLKCDYVNGLLEGKKIYYYDQSHNGNSIYGGIEKIISFKNGIKNGKEFEYRKTKLIDINDYDSKGVLKSESNYVNGKLEGFSIKYHSNGNMKEKLFYKNGKGEGEFLKYYDSGQLESVAYMVHGIYEGEFITYYKSGKILNKCNYKGGIKIGLDTRYTEEGNIDNQERWIESKDKNNNSVSILDEVYEAKKSPLYYLEQGFTIKETAKKLKINEADLRKEYGGKYD